jgi:Fic family protein
MFGHWRLKRVHAKFLESSRNLKEGRTYWDQAAGLKRWFLEAISPVPLLGLHEDGQRLLEALRWLEVNCRKRPLGEETIREYHKMVYKGGAEPPGDYRKGRIAVQGSVIPRPPPEKVPVMMRQLNLKLVEEQERFDAAVRADESGILAVAVDAYQRIGLIHPFGDANGRVARLAMNHLCRRYRLAYVILPPLSEASPLWEALQEAHRGKLETLVAYAQRCRHRV